MKKIVFFICLLTISQAIFAIDIPEEVLSVYRKKDYFKLKEYENSPNLNSQQKLFVSAIVKNAFNENKKSVLEINKYISGFPAEYSDTLYVQLLETQVDNYVKLNEYAQAAVTTEKIIKMSSDKIRTDEVKDLKNNLRIWKALSGVKKQQIIKDGDQEIEFKRDIANLMNIGVECNLIKENAVFDTGANISVIMESLAEKMNIKALGDSINVKAVTGIEVIAKIGVAEELKISGVTAKNVLFLIFPDSALTFGAAYKINMIIGFPLIKDLGQLVFELKDQKIYITNNDYNATTNMFINGLTPVIKINFEKENLLFSFDSGAKRTHFHKLFLSVIKNYNDYKLVEDSIKIGGAGGMQTTQIYNVENVKLKILDKEINLKKIDILKNDLTEGAEFTHGNLGQDVISSGKGFVLNYDKMFFKILD